MAVNKQSDPAAGQAAPSPDSEQVNGVELRTRVPAEIRNVSFPNAVRGYDRNAVDAYVRTVNRVIAELEVSRSPQAAVRHAVERVTEQTKSVLDEAKDSAEKIIATAQDEADRILAEAKAQAADLVVNASAEAERLGAEGAQTLARARTDADGIVARAKEEGETIVTQAQSEAAETRRRTEEEITASQEQADARLRELQADTDTVWRQRHELLGEIEDIAGRLHVAAADAAARFSAKKTEEPAEEDVAPVDPEAATAITEPTEPESVPSESTPQA